MPIDDRDPRAAQAASAAPELRAAIDEALATRSEADRASLSDQMDPGWLGVGIWLGLMRPREARRILELIEAGDADRLTASDGRSTPVATEDAPSTGELDAPGQVPVGSMLLARAASMSEREMASDRSASRFGWAARLSRSEILSMGGVVDAMIARGAPADLARGFGLAWDGGVRLPRDQRDGLLTQFVELETEVAEVLTGRDLRPRGPARRSIGLAGLFDSWLARPKPVDTEVSAAIAQGGELARLGLIALWNVWVATRFRALIPRPTYELLVEPWVSVAGPLAG